MKFNLRFGFYQVVCFICMLIVISCSNKKAVSELNTQNKINERAVLKYKETRSFIIRFTNLVYEKDGKELRIPIFQGNMGDVSYKEFRKYCLDNKFLEPNVAESSFIIKTDKGKLTKTFREFLNFYKKNILKDVDISKPAKIKLYSDNELSIYYDFEINDVPFVLQLDIITYDKIKSLSSIKSILEINLDEKVENSIFRYRFWDDYTSEEL